MEDIEMSTSRSTRGSLAFLLALAVLVGGRSAHGGGSGVGSAATPALLPTVPAGRQSAYLRTDLVSDDTTVVPAAIQDPNLVNAWGIAYAPNNPIWVNDNGTGLSTVYAYSDATKLVTTQPLVVTVPPPSNGQPPAKPTGIVFNATVMSDAPAFDGDLFIFATEDGTISGWQQASPPPNPDHESAVLRVDNSASEDGAVYKGLALAMSGSGPRLYASNFRSGRVDVFDGSYAPVRGIGTEFTDAALPKGYAPFGIAAIDGRIYVTYALQGEEKEDDVKGPGHGFVDVFTTEGRLLRRFASRGPLNSPWAVVLAPSTGFGSAGRRLLIGNFGDGAINVFDPITGAFSGPLSDANGDSIAIDGLWALRFGGGGPAGPASTLFFTAGPHEEANGLFGKIELASTPG
jgi:uncharacterized protein (TIGR03118 family)